MWKTLFGGMLRTIVVRDQLYVSYPDGSSAIYGPPDGECAHIAIADSDTLRRLCLNPELALGEAFMDDRITLNNITLDGFLRLIIRNREAGTMPIWLRAQDTSRLALRCLVQLDSSPAPRSTWFSTTISTF